MMLSRFREHLDLLLRILYAGDGSKDVLGESPRVRILLQVQDALLNVGPKAQEHQNLRDPGAGDALAAGNFGLADDLAAVELAAPLDGPAKRLGDARRSAQAWVRPA